MTSIVWPPVIHFFIFQDWLGQFYFSGLHHLNNPSKRIPARNHWVRRLKHKRNQFGLIWIFHFVFRFLHFAFLNLNSTFFYQGLSITSCYFIFLNILYFIFGRTLSMCYILEMLQYHGSHWVESSWIMVRIILFLTKLRKSVSSFGTFLNHHLLHSKKGPNKISWIPVPHVLPILT